MEPYTLVVIDVQPTFKAASRVLEPVGDEMRAAIRRGLGILLVEYSGQGRTLVRDVADMYPRCWTIVKHSGSGAREVTQALVRHNLPPRVRVCGVNTLACVLRTVAELPSPVEVVEKGCWCFTPTSHKLGLQRMRSLPHVQIVPRL